MNILYLWFQDYPWEVRVEKVCRSLRDAGHSVHIVARNTRRLPEEEVLDGLHVHRLKPRRTPRMDTLLTFPFFLNPVWTSHLERTVRANCIDLIIVRDLPMAIAGLAAGKRHGIPVILDMAEDYVAMLWDIWKLKKASLLNLVVRNPLLARLVERYSLPKFDHVLVVTEEAVQIVERGGGNPAKVTVVGNTPPKGVFERGASPPNDELRLIGSRCSAIYTGNITPNRGLDIVFRAIPRILAGIPDFLFVILGDGYAADAYREIARKERVEDHVLWLGWIEHDRSYDYVRESNMGLIPHYVTPHINTTVPNKIFDYMGCGVPVLSADADPLERIVNETGCGLVFRDRDPESLARAVLEIHRSDTDYGGNGLRAFREKYNWEEDAKRLVGVVERLFSGRQPDPGP